MRKLENNLFFIGISILFLCIFSLFDGSEPIFYNLPLVIINLLIGLIIFSMSGFIYFIRIITGDTKKEITEIKAQKTFPNSTRKNRYVENKKTS
jgi:hypothetical protein